MKTWFLGSCAFVVALLAWLFLSQRAPENLPGLAAPNGVVQITPEPAAPVATESAAPPAASAGEAAVPQGRGEPSPAVAAAPVFTNLPPAVVLENVRHAIRDYAARFGGNPVGTNPEIARALGGENPRHVNFLDQQAGMRLNEKGELVDPWGVPFFFHQLSAQEMEIRSAGPDRRMWTDDDLVTR
jgi:hypothetical protein